MAVTPWKKVIWYFMNRNRLYSPADMKKSVKGTHDSWYGDPAIGKQIPGFILNVVVMYL